MLRHEGYYRETTMYIMWEWRALKRERNNRSLRAILVRCRWVDGRPRKERISYLAWIREQKLHSPTHREAFWGCGSPAGPADPQADPGGGRGSQEARL